MNRWVERLSNWQFVAALAGTMILAFAVGGLVLALTIGLNIRAFSLSSAVITAAATGAQAWRRWK